MKRFSFLGLTNRGWVVFNLIQGFFTAGFTETPLMGFLFAACAFLSLLLANAEDAIWEEQEEQGNQDEDHD